MCFKHGPYYTTASKAPHAGHKCAHAQICLGLKDKKNTKNTQIELLCQFFYYFRKNFPNIFEGQEVDSNLLAILRSSEALVVSGTVRSLQQWKLILSARDFSRDASPALANLFSPGYHSMNWLTRINTASKKEEQAVTC